MADADRPEVSSEVSREAVGEHGAGGEPETGGEHGLERLLVFGDAVVAIAITLVVLPLVEAAQDLHGRTAWEFVQDNRDGLGAAGLSFLVIWVMWRPQHQYFERTHGYTPRTPVFHMLWLAAMVVLPLPTLLLVESPHGDRSAPVLYVATVFAAIVLTRLEYIDLWRARLLTGPAVTWTAWLTPAAALAALALAFVPHVDVWGLLLLGVAGRLEARLGRRAAR